MMGLKKKSLPYTLAKDLEVLFSHVKAIQMANSDILIVDIGDDMILFKDSDPESNYFFRIYHFDITEMGISSFKATYCPESHSSLKETTSLLGITNLFSQLEWWVQLIKNYNQISYNEQESFQIVYEQEFFDAFEIVDDDADTVPFDLAKQLLLDKFLSDISSALEERKDQYEVQGIINEVEQVKKEITVSTKKVLIKKISSILSKIRLQGLDLLKDVVKDYIKDVIKEGFKIALEVGVRYINTPH